MESLRTGTCKYAGELKCYSTCMRQWRVKTNN